jgi:RecJ-like exonuclease
MKKCESCQGTGKFWLHYERMCLVCKGTGEVHMTLENYIKDYGLFVQRGTLEGSKDTGNKT